MTHNIETIMYDTLKEIGGNIKTSKVSMFDPTLPFKHPPFLRFCFFDDRNSVREKLKKLVKDFSGNLGWGLYTRNEISNIILLPNIFQTYLDSKGFYDRNTYVKDFGDQKYEELVLLAINDIEDLSNFLLENWNKVSR